MPPPSSSLTSSPSLPHQEEMCEFMCLFFSRALSANDSMLLLLLMVIVERRHDDSKVVVPLPGGLSLQLYQDASSSGGLFTSCRQKQLVSLKRKSSSLQTLLRMNERVFFFFSSFLLQHYSSNHNYCLGMKRCQRMRTTRRGECTHSVQISNRASSSLFFLPCSCSFSFS